MATQVGTRAGYIDFLNNVATTEFLRTKKPGLNALDWTEGKQAYDEYLKQQGGSPYFYTQDSKTQAATQAATQTSTQAGTTQQQPKNGGAGTQPPPGDIISGLPPLRGKASGESSIDPRLQPYLELGLRRAEQLFFGPGPQFFPGQTYVSPSEQTLAALQQQEALATGAQPALAAAQKAYLSGLQADPTAVPMYQDIYGAAGTQPGAETFRTAATGGFVNPALAGYQDVAGGSFLTGSPYLESVIQRATRPVAEQFLEQTMPTIASQFSAAGRYGSGAMERATGRAQEAASRAIGDIATNIASQDYARERGFQEQARAGLAGLGAQDIQNRLAGATGLESAAQAAAQRQLSAAGGIASTEQAARQAQLAAAGMAPQFYQQQFLPSQQLAQIGAAREAIDQQPLQEQMARHQFEQGVPYQQLSGFLSSIYGTPMGSSQYQTIPQAQTNQFGQALGGAFLGSQLAPTFGFSPTTGAIFGGGLGFLG